MYKNIHLIIVVIDNKHITVEIHMRKKQDCFLFLGYRIAERIINI